MVAPRCLHRIKLLEARDMTHGSLVWEVTTALIVALLLFDYFFHIRTAHVHRHRGRPDSP